jgi:uncharacterized protein YndB with AHSA1/START domain
MTTSTSTWREVQSQPTSVSHHIDAAPEHVFNTLSDPWRLPLWVVGAVHIRAVDSGWPEVGSRVHHQVGAWPVTVSDSTEVVEIDPRKRLVLQGRAWPFGEARIELIVEADGDGTLVEMREAPTHGPPRVLDNPLLRRILAIRNRESLLRLAAIAEERHRPQE